MLHIYSFIEILIVAGRIEGGGTLSEKEEQITVSGIPDKYAINASFVSVIAGNVPGVVIQNSPWNESNSGTRSFGLAFYSAMESSQKAVYNWMVIEEDAYEDAEFQHGTVKVMYDVFEKCVNISFTEVRHKVAHTFYIDYA